MTKSIPLSRAAARVAAALCACLLPLVLAHPAAAAKGASRAPAGENTPLNLGGSSSGAAHTSAGGGASLVRTIVGLAIVIAVIWGLSWILRQVKAGRDPSVPSGGLASVAALQLGSGRSLHLVRAGSDYVLLGANEHGLAPIQRYTEQQAREVGLLEEPQQARARTAFARQLIAAQFAPREAAPGEFTPGRVVSGRVAAGTGQRPNPMAAPGPAAGLVERLREWTVRR